MTDSGEEAALGNLGIAYFSLGEYVQALDHFEKALAISRDLDDRRGECMGLGNRGRVYEALGKRNDAIESFEKQLQVAREIGASHSESIALNNLADIYSKSGGTAPCHRILRTAVYACA